MIFKKSLFAVVAIMLMMTFAGKPAQALTVLPSENLDLSVINPNGGVLVFSGADTFQKDFNIVGLPASPQVTSSLGVFIFGNDISSFTLQWEIAGSLVSVAQDASLALTQTLTEGVSNILRVTAVSLSGTGLNILNVQISAVPLPPAALLFGSALLGIGFLARRRRKSPGSNKLQPS